MNDRNQEEYIDFARDKIDRTNVYFSFAVNAMLNLISSTIDTQ